MESEEWWCWCVVDLFLLFDLSTSMATGTATAGRYRAIIRRPDGCCSCSIVALRQFLLWRASKNSIAIGGIDERMSVIFFINNFFSSPPSIASEAAAGVLRQHVARVAGT
jgi:hypothetical protein